MASPRNERSASSNLKKQVVINLRSQIGISSARMLMNKFELIQSLKDTNCLTSSDAKTVVELFFDSMADALANGQRVEIRGLCIFKVKEYKGYAGRNPKTGDLVTVKPKRLPFFKVGNDLKERMNSRAPR